MNKKQWCIIASSLVLAFCLCTEEGDTNPVGGGGGDGETTDFVGKWKMKEFVQTNYDAQGNEIDNPYATDPYEAYMALEEATFTVYTPTDTCMTIDGPYEYTLSENTMSYMWLGFMEVNQELELKNGNMLITTPMAVQDETTGEVLSTLVTVAEWEPYAGTLPESSWPTEACPATY